MVAVLQWCVSYIWIWLCPLDLDNTSNMYYRFGGLHVIMVVFMQLLWVVACPSCCWCPAGATDGIFLDHFRDLCCLPHPRAATTSHHSDLLLLSVLLGWCRSSCHSAYILTKHSLCRLYLWSIPRLCVEKLFLVPLVLFQTRKTGFVGCSLCIIQCLIGLLQQ